MILDCTFRDGGYYVNWDFDETVVHKYLKALELSKIDIIELGFRFMPKNKFYGAFAYTTDEFINTLPIPEKIQISVMVNASDLIDYEDGIEKAVKCLFTEKNNSRVDIVRIAVHVKDISPSKELAGILKSLGYFVCLNVMQVDSLSNTKLKEIASQIESWQSVDTLYFADSFGNMSHEGVVDTIKAFKEGWSGKIGFHAHDNKGQALTNCVSALKNGIDIIDSTILGMGRGAGNVKTESILVEMTEMGIGNYFADSLFPIVMKEFKKLHVKHGWGTNIFYYLSAIYGIHPTYIQEMLIDDRYDTNQIISTINFLKSQKSSSFSRENLNIASSGFEGDENGTWDLNNFCKDKTVLIIGSGPSTKKYIKNIQQYITKNKPLVLCLNINESVPEELVDAYVACHDTRILIESDSYSKIGKPIIIPLSRVPEKIIQSIKDVDFLDYGLKVQKNSFKILNNGCVLDKPLALAYAISVATAGRAKKIFLCGVDGYPSSESRQIEVVEMLKNYSEITDSLEILALTPTTYPIYQSSIFAPNL